MEHFVEDLGAQGRIAGVLGQLRKLDVLVDLLSPIDDDASQVQAALKRSQVILRLHHEPLLPQAVEMPSLLLVASLDIVDDLFELLQALKILDQRVRPAIRLAKQRRDLRVQNLPSSFNIVVGSLEALVLDLEYRLIEAFVESRRVLRALDHLDVLGEVRPVAQVP